MSNPKLILYVIDLFSNINKKVKKNLLPKNIGQEATNVRYDIEAGSLNKRSPRAKYNSTTYGTLPIHSQFRHYKATTDSSTLLFGYGTAIKVGYDDISGIASTIKTGITSHPLSFLTYKDLCFIVNNSMPNSVFTFVSKTKYFEDMGIPSSTAPSGTVSATAGSLSGSVFYAMSLQYDSYQEGNASPSSAVVAVNASKCTVTIPTSASTRCTGRYLYRTVANGGVLYRLGLVSNNTDTAYGDNIADSSLDTTIVAPINYDIPSIGKFICFHKERVWIAKGSTLIYSDLRNGTSYPDVFPSTNVFYITKDDGDECAGVFGLGFDKIVFFKKNSVSIVDTTSDSDISWGLYTNVNNQGCIAPFSAIETPKGIMYLTRYGENKKRLVLWDSNGFNVISELEGIEPILSGIPNTDLDSIKAAYANGYYMLAYRDVESGVTYNNRVLNINIFDWSSSIDTKNIASFSVWSKGSDIHQVYSGSSDTTGLIMKEDSADSDLILRYKSEVDEGVYSRTVSGGTEIMPSITLTSTISSNMANWVWANCTKTWANSTSVYDTWWNTGEWLDKIRDIGANTLQTIFWNETLPTNTYIQFFVRSGSTEEACEAASWGGPYSSPQGSSLTSVSAARYIQIRAKLFCKYIDDSYPIIYRKGTLDNDFIIKISLNKGTVYEDTIEFEWRSGDIDLGNLNEVYKRLRKRLRSVKIEYEASNTSAGNLTFNYYLNGSSSPTGNFNTSFSGNPYSKIYNFPLNTFCDYFNYGLYSNSDNQSLKIKKITFTISTEPYYSNR